jgi:hypothetical protein
VGLVCLGHRVWGLERGVGSPPGARDGTEAGAGRGGVLAVGRLLCFVS